MPNDDPDVRRRGSAARFHVPLKLTERAIEALPASPGADYVVMDLGSPGFGVRVSWRGTAPRKAYFFGYRLRASGASRRVTIGAVGVITLKDARTQAAALARSVALGEDPSGERRRRREQAITVEHVGVTYLENVHARQKPNTAAEYERLWNKHVVPALGRRPVAEVDVSEIRRLHNSLAATPYLANRLLAVISAFFTFARREGWRPDNPARDESLERYPEASRERFLSPAEVTKLGEALTTAETVGLPPAPEHRKPAPTKRPQNRPKGADVPNPANPHAVAALRLLLLTGCRESEIRTLRWDAVDLERGFLRLADTKTGKSVRPLGAAAAELLSSVRKVHRSPYVFPGLRPSVPLRSVKRLWHAVRYAAGLPDVRLHDLRHSFASFSAIGGDSLLVTRALLGHRTVASTSRYAHLSDDPVRSAADRVAGDLAALLGGQQTTVTPLRKGRN